MSIIARQLLIKKVEKALGSYLTVNDVETVMSILTEQLSDFQIEENEKDVQFQDFIEFLETFLDAKKIEGRSDKTLEHYRYVLERFQKEIKTPVRDITVFNVRNYFMKEKNRGISDATLEGNRSVLSSFFSWLYNEGLLPSNPCANLSAIKCTKKVKLPYTDVEIEKLKESCRNNRDRAIVSFLLSTGCRISELCGLNRDSLDFESHECVVFGKGNKERTVFMDDVTIMLLKRYLESRTDEHEALFIGRGTERLTPGGIRRELNIIADRANVEHVHPHRFRRTLATNLINRGMPIQEVASILGHDKLDTTMTYIYMSKDNIKNSYNKFS